MEATLTMPAAAPVQKQQGLNQVVINKVRRMVEGPAARRRENRTGLYRTHRGQPQRRRATSCCVVQGGGPGAAFDARR